MAGKEGFRPRVEDQREAANLQDAQSVEQLFGAVDETRLVARNVSGYTRVILVGDAEEGAKRAGGLQRSRTGHKVRGLDARTKART